MYKIIKNPRRITREEMSEVYDNKWLFLINPEPFLGGAMHSAIPVVVADKPWEGSETGIYDKIEENENGDIYSTMSYSLLPRIHDVFGFTEIEVPDDLR